MNVVLLGSNTKEEIENNLRIVASAGALSRSEGTVMDVYESKNDYQKNLRLAKAVVGYGHRSISEHDYLVFALEDVTPVIEQTIIEYRLTSFTIKSRRNVDFRNVGFYVPDFKTVKEDKDIKKKMFTSLLHSKNQRELEKVAYSFELPISLAVLTHISRHRMQSLLVPDFVPLWNMENYVIPNSIKDNHEEEYRDIFKKNNLKVEEYKDK